MSTMPLTKRIAALLVLTTMSLVPTFAEARGRISPEEAAAWSKRPWIVGSNFLPSTAINQLEMWQAETFDEETIRRELGWAAAIGHNAARVYLHDLAWAQDGDALLDRIDRFLGIADEAGIAAMLVFFDGVWDPHPVAGEQRAPRPRVHNSGWVQSPGVEVLDDPARHDELEPYVRAVVRRFRGDPRVLAWDLFNEPDNPNPAYGAAETPNKVERATALLKKAFEWARAENPSQPLTAGVYRGNWGDPAALSEINRVMLEESDIITFHDYGDPEHVRRSLEALERYGRPIVCTEYLARSRGSTFETVLPIFQSHSVGAINWGLVAGKSQTQYPWSSWRETFTSEPDPWFHDIFRPDGTPYREAEVALIRRLTGRP